ncbi:MAG TPA: hypothetical protein VEA81_03130 [Burkholderiaceae bacterium]|nr:hypothetical protein [Burkholderiaceae bacterium]
MHAAVPVPIYRPGQTAVPHRGGCPTCEHFLGEFVAHGAHVVCRHGSPPVVHADPRGGCAFHLRAPGSD